MKKEIELEIGQRINVDVIKGKKGVFPIGKYGSITCKLFIPKSVGHIEYGCTCLCKVTAISERSINVTVLEVVRSTAANNFALQERLKSVKPEEQPKNGRMKNQAVAEALKKACEKKLK